MAKINQLSAHVADLIAAGEVVERPASVVKELVENAIDAGSTTITVEIKNGGISYIRVSDNGSGIASAEAPIAFLRHATSKIQTEEDLITIGSLGFRGEALAAIAAVSKVDIFTKRRQDAFGTQLTLVGGAQIDLHDVGCPDGTTVVVRELFYNTPARMKFLKNDKTEGANVAGTLEHLAFSRPNISMKLIKDGKEVFSTPGDGYLEKVIYSIYGTSFAGELMQVSGRDQSISIHGMISPAHISRSNKNMQNFFINGRFVKSKLLTAALERAYQGRLVQGRMPLCFINLAIPLSSVDVNVHPSKLEVRFSNEKKVFDVIYNVITDALNSVQLSDKSELIISETPENPVRSNDLSTYPKSAFTNGEIRENGTKFTEFHKNLLGSKIEEIERLKNESPMLALEAEMINKSWYATASEPEMFASRRVSEPPRPVAYNYQTTSFEAIDNSASAADATKPPVQMSFRDAIIDKVIASKKQEKVNYRLIGEIFNTYIIIEHNGEMKLIDKHAAHERIVYNKLIGERVEYFAQGLLEPVTVSLTRDEKGIILDNGDILAELGFEVEDFGTNIIAVRKAPVYVPEGEIPYVITAIIDKIVNFKFTHSDLVEDIIKNISCKAAIKAGFINVAEELSVIVDEVLTKPSLATCPHGRPTVFSMSKEQIEKMFKRT